MIGAGAQLKNVVDQDAERRSNGVYRLSVIEGDGVVANFARSHRFVSPCAVRHWSRPGLSVAGGT